MAHEAVLVNRSALAERNVKAMGLYNDYKQDSQLWQQTLNGRLNLRSEAHHRIHATEGTGEEGSDTGYWERKGEKIREKINMTPISKL